MSDIPDCRRCGAQLALDEMRGVWVCPNSECENFDTTVLLATDDAPECEWCGCALRDAANGVSIYECPDCGACYDGHLNRVPRPRPEP